MSIRDIRNRSRLALHNALKLGAIYVDLDAATQTPCTVRVHNRVQLFGDMAGFDYAPAEQVAEVPKIVSLNSEVAPARGGIFSLSATEAYEVEFVPPQDGITTKSECTRMRQADIDAAALPVPTGV